MHLIRFCIFCGQLKQNNLNFKGIVDDDLQDVTPEECLRGTGKLVVQM